VKRLTVTLKYAVTVTERRTTSKIEPRANAYAPCIHFINPFISRKALWETKLGKESFLYECFQCFAKLDCPGHLRFQRASKRPKTAGPMNFLKPEISLHVFFFGIR